MNLAVICFAFIPNQSILSGTKFYGHISFYGNSFANNEWDFIKFPCMSFGTENWQFSKEETKEKDKFN